MTATHSTTGVSPNKAQGNLKVVSATDVCAFPQSVFRKDYKPPDYFIDHVDLNFDLHKTNTRVEAKLRMYRNKTTPEGASLVLHGAETLKLADVRILIPDKHLGDERLVLQSPGDVSVSRSDFNLQINGDLLPKDADQVFIIHTVVYINPATNTELMGLYVSNDLLCTQCEAQGFRRITYFIDRPDVMATYTVRLSASKSQFPILLSNGNPKVQDECETRDDESRCSQMDRHTLSFEDPFPKPSYLFAIVAGDLSHVDGFFETADSRKIKLSIWCEPSEKTKLSWALQSVKDAMRWDEEQFGRIYDLDAFHVVAVSHFNMGAMENKGLNIFNSALLLASPTTATDCDYARIRGVVGHEYFHNWTGNRVTCRDWFQLTLKEGLTVFRDQEFNSDLHSRAVERINAVNLLRARQFAEDAGPMAHPIRPESYAEIDNFYTMTVYRKGAEVIRMYQTLLTRPGFRKGLDLYFERFDGKAVTCDDFLKAMEDANDFDLSVFSRWYSQAGTPTVWVEKSAWNEKEKQFVLSFRQCCAHAAGEDASQKKLPLYIPVAVGLISRQTGVETHSTRILHLTEEKQDFFISDVHENVIPSLFRGFSAPVQVVTNLSLSDYAHLFTYDSDCFNRWESSQVLMTRAIQALVKSAGSHTTEVERPEAVGYVIRGVKQILVDAKSSEKDRNFLANCLEFPSFPALLRDVAPCDPMSLYDAVKRIKKQVATELQDDFMETFKSLSEELRTTKGGACEMDLSLSACGQRAMIVAVINYLTETVGTQLAFDLFQKNPHNLTLRMGALLAMNDFPGEHRDEALRNFKAAATTDKLLLQKWFSIQARSNNDSIIETLQSLIADRELVQLDNPNDVRAIYGSFGLNFPRFHQRDGSGYSFMADAVVSIDKINNRIAAGLVSHLIDFKSLVEPYSSLMRKQLNRINGESNLGSQTREVVSKALVDSAE